MDFLTYLPGAFLIGLLLMFYLRIFRSSRLFKYFWAGLILKVSAGLFLGWLYFNYYAAGDTISYHQDAVLLRSLFLEDFTSYLTFLLSDNLPEKYISQIIYYTSSPRALFYVKIISIINIAFFNHYYLISIFISLFAFGGLFYLSGKLSELFPEGKSAAIISLLFMPSVVLWTSGVIKESVTIGCLAYLIGIGLSDISKKSFMNWTRWSFCVICFVLIWKLKYYYAAAFIPMLSATWLIYKASHYSNSALLHKYRLVSWASIMAILLVIVSLSQFNLNFNNLPEVILKNHNAFIEKSQPGDFILFDELEASWESIAKNSPRALFAGLFRPFILDGNTAFKWFSILESLALFLLLIWNLPKLKKGFLGRNNLFVFTAITYITNLAIFLSLSTPNFGTLIRYKAGFFFMFSYLILYDHPIFAIINKRLKWKSQ